MKNQEIKGYVMGISGFLWEEEIAWFWSGTDKYPTNEDAKNAVMRLVSELKADGHEENLFIRALTKADNPEAWNNINSIVR